MVIHYHYTVIYYYNIIVVLTTSLQLLTVYTSNDVCGNMDAIQYITGVSHKVTVRQC